MKIMSKNMMEHTTANNIRTRDSNGVLTDLTIKYYFCRTAESTAQTQFKAGPNSKKLYNGKICVNKQL
jgi:hypothetical protein